MNTETLKSAGRRTAAGIALAIAPALLAVGFAASSQANYLGGSNVVPNPGPQIHAGQNYAGGVNGTSIKPGSREHHHWQRMNGLK